MLRVLRRPALNAPAAWPDAPPNIPKGLGMNELPDSGRKTGSPCDSPLPADQHGTALFGERGPEGGSSNEALLEAWSIAAVTDAGHAVSCACSGSLGGFLDLPNKALLLSLVQPSGS